MLDDLGGVEAKLARIFQANADAPVIIDPDNATPLGDVIDVYDLSRRSRASTKYSSLLRRTLEVCGERLTQSPDFALKGQIQVSLGQRRG